MFSIFNKAKGKDFHPHQFNITEPTAVSQLHSIVYFTYYIYIITDKKKKKMKIDITGALSSRLHQLEREGAMDNRLPCIYVVYWESFSDVQQTLVREREIRKLSKKGRRALISNTNPEWEFLNEKIHQTTLLPSIASF